MKSKITFKPDGNDIYFSTGYNFKFTDIQAALGLSQLKDIKQRIKKKRQIFKIYFNKLSKINGISMFKFKNKETPWFCDIYIKNPKKLQKYLYSFNIVSRLVYPPLNSLKILKTKGDFKNSTYYCNRGIWLPSSISLNKKEIEFILSKIKNFIKNNA